MTDREKLLTKINQLLALAKSTNFPHEAEVAQSKVSMLVSKHNVTRGEFRAFRQSLNPKRNPPSRPRPTTPVYAWTIILGSATFTFSNGTSDNLEVNVFNFEFSP